MNNYSYKSVSIINLFFISIIIKIGEGEEKNHYITGGQTVDLTYDMKDDFCWTLLKSTYIQILC